MAAFAVDQHQGLIRAEAAQRGRVECAAIAQRRARVVQRRRELGQGRGQIHFTDAFEVGGTVEVHRNRHLVGLGLDARTAADHDDFLKPPLVRSPLRALRRRRGYSQCEQTGEGQTRHSDNAHVVPLQDSLG